MKAKQLYYLLIAATVVLALGFVSVGYGADKLLSSQAGKLSKLKADSDALDTLQTSLQQNKADIAKFGQLNQIAETVVPQDKDQAEAVREIVKLASDSGIDKLSSVTFPSSTLGTVVPGKKVNPELTQLTPVKGISGVYELPITIGQDNTDLVPYSSFITFLTKLEQNRRTAQVSSITVQPDNKNTNMVAFTLIINEFIKP